MFAEFFQKDFLGKSWKWNCSRLDRVFSGFMESTIGGLGSDGLKQTRYLQHPDDHPCSAFRVIYCNFCRSHQGEKLFPCPDSMTYIVCSFFCHFQHSSVWERERERERMLLETINFYIYIYIEYKKNQVFPAEMTPLLQYPTRLKLIFPWYNSYEVSV